MSATGFHPWLVELGKADASAALELSTEVARRYPSIESGELLTKAMTLAQELPRDLRDGLNAYRLQEPSCVCLISGFPLDDADPGPTPSSWRDLVRTPRPTRAAEAFFLLCAMLLGEPFAWSAKQAGRIMHDVVPTSGDEFEQLASGSTASLTWHTEDGFHPCRADYVGLMCLRNPDRVPTHLACIDAVELSAEHVEALFGSSFAIVADDSHTAQQQLTPGGPGSSTSDMGAGPMAEAEPIGLLFGDPHEPYLRIDEIYARRVVDDPVAAEALDALRTGLSRSLTGYPLSPGDVLFIDNFRAVHGRAGFRARYDGTDRWLKRLNLTRDLRRSRARRTARSSRVVA